jgi:hypothetical protein
LVATPSVNPEIEESGAGEAEVAELTAGWLRAWGLSVEMSEVEAGRWNVVGRLEGGGDGPTLLLNGHLDTVGVTGMTVEPFGGELQDGRLWGRGACDMKGGVAALLAATAQGAPFVGGGGGRGAPHGQGRSGPTSRDTGRGPHRGRGARQLGNGNFGPLRDERRCRCDM